MTARRVLVTGGSAGLGQALVTQFAADGYDVVSIDRTAPVNANGMVHIQCDLADRNALDTTMPVILAAGPFEFVILNAGANATGPFEELPSDTSKRLMRLNAEAPMVLASTLVRENSINGGACFISSLSHFTGYPGASAYAASKDAVAVYARSIRKPFLSRGVTVTLAFPGPLQTGHAQRHAPPDADAAKRMHPVEAARAIKAAVEAGRRLVIPGAGPKTFALAGRLMPQFVTRQMRKLIFEKLDGSVW